MKIKFREEVYLFSLPIKESEIIVFFLGTSLKDEVLKTLPVQKQLLMMAGTDDRYTFARGCTATLNSAEATFDAISN
ncbi:hypothetical protein MJG53_000681 [Ovis ammon polii x Ovis aries]|uniref:Uncharacterized protein n=1 Tax=Ovis ammon polii x Ovis aries TaxID=2918886 RepID=A0ACB9VIR3_9CETA|nr:hypothetical protein MJG53_000681 [Ovis ammon polii x Ovis aries]